MASHPPSHPDTQWIGLHWIYPFGLERVDVRVMRLVFGVDGRLDGFLSDLGEVYTAPYLTHKLLPSGAPAFGCTCKACRSIPCLAVVSRAGWLPW